MFQLLHRLPTEERKVLNVAQNIGQVTLWLSWRDYTCRSGPPDTGGGISHNLASTLPPPPPAPSRPLSPQDPAIYQRKARDSENGRDKQVLRAPATKLGEFHLA